MHPKSYSANPGPSEADGVLVGGSSARKGLGLAVHESTHLHQLLWKKRCFLLPSGYNSDIFVSRILFVIMVKDSLALITRKECWNDYYLLSLESPIISTQANPGQFIMVRISSHPYPLLRRPFSIHAQDGKNIDIFFKKTGVGTALLSEKKKDDFLDILGPLGTGFGLERISGQKEVAVIGGGRGIAPLYFLARRLSLQGSSAKIFYGGKTHADLPLKKRIETDGFQLLCSTDDGSLGFHGLITELFNSEMSKFSPEYIYACGPESMLREIAHIALDKKIPAEFSLESVMGCGFGACWGCVKKIKKGKEEGWHKICEEGPVFRTEEIIWQNEGK